MNGQTSNGGRAAAAASAPARPVATKADAAQNKADGATADKGKGKKDEEADRPLIIGLADDVAAGGASDVEKAGAGAVEGNFIARRELEGDRSYKSGDPREGKVSDLIHLVRSGALSPADKATAEACNVYGNLSVDVFNPKKAKAAEGEG